MFFDSGGQSIFYEEFGAGDPLLLMPGFSEGADDFGDLVATLAAQYRVVAADLPGSGRSQPQPRDYPVDFYRQDAQSMAALLSDLDSGPFHVLGFSDGGEVALMMGVEHPEVVRSIVAWGAAGSLSESMLPELETIGEIVDAPPADLLNWRAYLVGKYGEEAARSMTQSWAEASRAIIQGGGDISLSRAGEIRCPVLIINGERDPYAPAPLPQQLAARIRNVQLVMVPGAGHSVHDERPQWFKQAVLEWLESGNVLDKA